MVRPDVLPQIIGTEDPEMTCSQYALGSEHYGIDDARLMLIRDKTYYRVRSKALVLKEGDFVVFGMLVPVTGDLKMLPNHIAKVDGDGLLVSKFYRNPNIYRHELMGASIEGLISFLGIEVFRKRDIKAKINLNFRRFLLEDKRA